MVKILVEDNKISEAYGILNFIIDNTNSDNIRDLAYIRKIRLLISSNELDDALNTIKKVNNQENHILLELSGSEPFPFLCLLL